MNEGKINLLEKHKNSEELQNEYLNLIEKTLKKPRSNKRELKPIFSDPNKSPTFIDRTFNFENKISEKEIRASEKIWLIVDFDDVLNKTTTYNNQIKKKICGITNLSEEEYSNLYNESKIANKDGKKVLRFNVLIEKIKKMNPGKEILIDKLLSEEIDLKKFIDQGVKRALLSLTHLGIKISILTFGDINYQKGRIDKTDVAEIVDEIIYTEGSKREVLETLIDKNYKSKGIIPPFVISIDDSPEQINDYNDVNLPNNFINMHFENPQASRFGKKPTAEEVIANPETKSNEAALNIFKIGKICLDTNMHKSRKQIYELLHGKNISDFYQQRNEYDMGKEKIFRKTYDDGKQITVYFSKEGHKFGTSDGQKVVLNGETTDDYYRALLNTIYHPSSATNIKYYQNIDGGIVREWDAQISKQQYGKQENTEKHVKRTVVEKSGKLALGALLSFEEEFIENAK